MSKDTLLEFPCDFPMKIMGESQYDIENLVKTLLKKQLKDDQILDLKSRTSEAGNYTSVTATIKATSKKQLDSLYKVLSKHKHIKMVL